ncbi:MAG: GTPase of the mitochondrial inner membrane that associates with the large ribosomal subunit [Piccolia ochrophora]|nr:MAG: GTPase of the mitochondrial inner membrane that associates with the large ribosomal subunit [Piccolia ochrophora]
MPPSHRVIANPFTLLLPLSFLHPTASLAVAAFTKRHVSQVGTGEVSSGAETSPPVDAHVGPPHATSDSCILSDLATSTDYSYSKFVDRCVLHLQAGSGGHGCASFLREKFVSAGPANGGDGGSGGSIYIQAVQNETSLHRLAHRGHIRAGRGKNGRGRAKGGERGGDVLIEVPVGTVVRELDRSDPATAEEESSSTGTSEVGADALPDKRPRWRRDQWILYPQSMPRELATADFPALPRPRRSNVTMPQLEAPVFLDLSKPMKKPSLLAAGAMGGLGNPHFVTKSIPRPKFATKGDEGLRITLELELKLLADVGLVGLPNAGKSTLLRGLSRSRARVGSWAFTTLQPNIGTVVLDDHRGPSKGHVLGAGLGARTHFTIADIPGLVEDAHLDKGLGLGFLRHVERARVLALVVDLGAGDAAMAVQGLWKELREYEASQRDTTTAHGLGDALTVREVGRGTEADATLLDDLRSPPPFQHSPPWTISTKPWFVIATKADMAQSQANFEHLQTFLDAVSSGTIPHPSGARPHWKGRVVAIPVSAIRKEGVGRITDWIVGLLNTLYPHDSSEP